MKKCAICGHESDGATCPRDGEASWLPVVEVAPIAPVVVDAPKDTDAAPVAAPKPAWRSKRR